MNHKVVNPEKVSLQHSLHRGDQSLLQRYQSRVLASDRLFNLAYYEIATLLAGPLPGALGFLLRKKLYPCLFKHFGKNVIIGRGVTLRHPDRVWMGDRVAIDNNVLIDAQGTGSEGMRIGSEVIISSNCIIQGKTGPVHLKTRADIGANTIVSSMTGVTIGRDTLIAGHCYIGGGQYNWKRTDIPMAQQGLYSKGPVVIGDDVWLGAGVCIIDGVTIGKGSIIGAGAVVTRDIPDYSIAMGTPAKVVGTRPKSESKAT